jgi:hypothetical protein
MAAKRSGVNAQPLRVAELDDANINTPVAEGPTPSATSEQNCERA